MKTNTVIFCMALAAFALVATGAWAQAEDTWTFDVDFDDGEEHEWAAWDDGLGQRFQAAGDVTWVCDAGGKLEYTKTDTGGFVGLTYLGGVDQLPLAGHDYFRVSLDAPAAVAGQTFKLVVRTVPSSDITHLPTQVLVAGVNVYTFDLSAEDFGSDTTINLWRLDLAGGAGDVYVIDWLAYNDSASFTPASQSTTCAAEGEGEGEGTPAEGEGEGAEEQASTIKASTNFPTVDGALTLSAPAGAAAPFQWYKDDIAISGATEATLSFPHTGTSNYGKATDTVAVKPYYASYVVTYNAESITWDVGGTLYFPATTGGASQEFSIDDEAWVFEATFTDADGDTSPELGLSGNGGYKELYADFYNGVVSLTGGTDVPMPGATSVALRMTATAAEIVCEANIDGAGYVTVGTIAHGTGTGDYTAWLYESNAYGYSGYEVDISDVSLTGYGIANVNNDGPEGVTASDFGGYTVSYDDGSKAIVTSDYFTLSALFPEDAEVPAAGLVGLGLLAGAGLIGGILRNRKK